MHIAQAKGGWTCPAADLVHRTQGATPKQKTTSSSSLSFSLLS
jgi:hypothetical protein